jgi:hypothetical protein
MAEFQSAWGTSEERQFEEFEVIGRPGKDPEELRATWETFIHTHHYTTCHDFFDSLIANHPRRSTEAWYSAKIEAKFLDIKPVPQNRNLEATVDWYQELIGHESEE